MIMTANRIMEINRRKKYDYHSIHDLCPSKIIRKSTETQYRPCRLGTATGSILRTEVGRGESRMESTSPALPRDSLSRE